MTELQTAIDTIQQTERFLSIISNQTRAIANGDSRDYRLIYSLIASLQGYLRETNLDEDLNRLIARVQDTEKNSA